jgi:hypothetical protein
MAKRKAARSTKQARKASKAAKKTKPRAAARTTARQAGKKKTRKTPKSAAPVSVKASARSRRSAKREGGRKRAGTTARKSARRSAPGIARKTPAIARKPPAIARKAPALDRERRTIQDDDIVPTPPSSLDLDRTASAVRTGRRQMHDRLAEHHETSPALTGGDVDADWESAATVGDEAPGGDNPTPDQDIVDDIGRAVGVQYEDNEELKGEEKIAKRDKHRWELDPASSEDYDDR